MPTIAPDAQLRRYFTDPTGRTLRLHHGHERGEQANPREARDHRARARAREDRRRRLDRRRRDGLGRTRVAAQPIVEPQTELVDPLWIREVSGVPVVRDVDRTTLEDIKLANEAIRKARLATPDGAGNQWSDLRASDGIGYARLKLARGYPGGWTIAQRAQNAAMGGGANCGEYAAMTFANLAAKGANKPIQTGHLKDLDHAFTMIGDHREPGNPIVVDAWVTRPQGNLWIGDSCWNDAEYGGFEILETYNNTKGDPKYDLSGIKPVEVDLDQARKIVRCPEDKTIMEMIEESNEKKNWVWAQEYATRRNSPYRYRWQA